MTLPSDGAEAAAETDMASGLVALLDDVTALARLAAVSLDDVTAASVRVGLKAAGVVVDDAAVTPRYVAGLDPRRELPIIGRIALGSLRNKLLILLPAALALSAFAPWAVTPLLMCGGAYLCFEGTEKVIEALGGHHAAPAEPSGADPKANEDRKVGGAIRTDLILSAEIMAISLAEVSDRPLVEQAIVLALVGLLITAAVYGVVAVVVKLDDIGLTLARGGAAPMRAAGRGLVRVMPGVMAILSAVGTAAMVWVGGGILLHGLEAFGFGALPHAVESAAAVAGSMVPAVTGPVVWATEALGAGILGLAVGGLIVGLAAAVRRAWGRPPPAAA